MSLRRNDKREAWCCRYTAHSVSSTLGHGKPIDYITPHDHREMTPTAYRPTDAPNPLLINSILPEFVQFLQTRRDNRWSRQSLRLGFLSVKHPDGEK